MVVVCNATAAAHLGHIDNTKRVTERTSWCPLNPSVLIGLFEFAARDLCSTKQIKHVYIVYMLYMVYVTNRLLLK